MTTTVYICVYVSRYPCAIKRVSPLFNWSGRGDSNARPPAPKAGALPGCATPRHTEYPSFHHNTGVSGLAEMASDGLQRPFP